MTCKPCSLTYKFSIVAKPNKRTSVNNSFHAGSPEVCRIGSNPQASTAHMISGTYLNADAPAECAGLITSWNVCYHPASAPDSDGAAILAVASASVYRPSEDGQEYRRINELPFNFPFVRDVSATKIICQEWPLSSDSQLRVNVGDIVGVVLPPTNPAPILSTGVDGSRVLYSASTRGELELSASQLQPQDGTAIHVHATGKMHVNGVCNN